MINNKLNNTNKKKKMNDNKDNDGAHVTRRRPRIIQMGPIFPRCVPGQWDAVCLCPSLGRMKGKLVSHCNMLDRSLEAQKHITKNVEA